MQSYHDRRGDLPKSVLEQENFRHFFQKYAKFQVEIRIVSEIIGKNFLVYRVAQNDVSKSNHP